MIWTVSGLSGQFLDYPDSLWIVRTVSKWAGKFIDYPDSLWIVRTLSRLSGKSLDCLDSSYIILTVSGLSGLDHGDGLLPFHRWSNGYLPLETIEKPSLPMVAGLQNH